MSMKDFGTVKNIEDTPFGYTLSVISGKWKMVILYWLAEYSALRFNTLHRLIKTVSYKTLSIQLKELEKDGIILRVEYPQIPPKVEYSLTEKGKSLYPLMEEMCRWGEQHRQG